MSDHEELERMLAAPETEEERRALDAMDCDPARLLNAVRQRIAGKAPAVPQGDSGVSVHVLGAARAPAGSH